jgi:hypothetical protein
MMEGVVVSTRISRFSSNRKKLLGRQMTPEPTLFSCHLLHQQEMGIALNDWYMQLTVSLHTNSDDKDSLKNTGLLIQP